MMTFVADAIYAWQVKAHPLFFIRTVLDNLIGTTAIYIDMMYSMQCNMNLDGSHLIRKSKDYVYGTKYLVYEKGIIELKNL